MDLRIYDRLLDGGDVGWKSITRMQVQATLMTLMAPTADR